MESTKDKTPAALCRMMEAMEMRLTSEERREIVNIYTQAYQVFTLWFCGMVQPTKQATDKLRHMVERVQALTAGRKA